MLHSKPGFSLGENAGDGDGWASLGPAGVLPDVSSGV